MSAAAAFSAASSAENALAPPAALAAVVSPDDVAGVAAAPLVSVDRAASGTVALDRAGAVAGIALPSAGAAAGAALPAQHPAAAAAAAEKAGATPQKPVGGGGGGGRSCRCVGGGGVLFLLLHVGLIVRVNLNRSGDVYYYCTHSLLLLRRLLLLLLGQVRPFPPSLRQSPPSVSFVKTVHLRDEPQPHAGRESGRNELIVLQRRLDDVVGRPKDSAILSFEHLPAKLVQPQHLLDICPVILVGRRHAQEVLVYVHRGGSGWRHFHLSCGRHAEQEDFICPPITINPRTVVRTKVLHHGPYPRSPCLVLFFCPSR